MVLKIIPEFLITVLGCWTVSNHLIFLLKKPAFLTLLPFLLLLLISCYVLKNRWLLYINKKTEPPLPLLLMAFVIGVICMSVYLPRSVDDITYFHRALFQMDKLYEPFYRTNTMLAESNLPPLSNLHLLTSYEQLLGVSSYMMNIDPIFLIQNAIPFIVGFLFSIIYYSLFCQFGLTRNQSLLAVVFSFIFLSFERELHRSWGNYLIGVAHHGKSILIFIVLPFFFSLATEYLRAPKKRILFLLFLSSISAVGLSGSGLFIIPIFSLCLSLAYISSHKINSKRIRTALYLNGSLLYLGLISFFVFFDLIPLPMNIDAWTINWPKSWDESFRLIYSNRYQEIRNLLILIIIPFLCLRGPLGWYVSILSVIMFFVFGNGLTGPFWHQLIKPAAYWRLMHIFPLIFCAGLFLAAIFSSQNKNIKKSLRWVILSSTLFFYFLGYRNPLPEVGFRFKSPFAPIFNPERYSFSKKVSDLINERTMLADPYLINSLAALNPSTKWEVHIPKQTLHVYKNSAKEEEGHQKIKAFDYLNGNFSQENREAFTVSLGRSVDGFIVKRKHESEISQLINESFPSWEKITDDANYALYLKRS